MKYPITAHRLRMAMDEKGMKAVELSAKTGIGKSSISQYMNGSHWPDDNRKVGLIAEALDVNPSWLMGFNVPMHDKKHGFYLEEAAMIAQKALDDSGLQKQINSHDNAGISEQVTYYTNPETAKVAQQIFDDPDLHALFDAAKDSKPEALKAAAVLLKTLKGTNPDG